MSDSLKIPFRSRQHRQRRQKQIAKLSSSHLNTTQNQNEKQNSSLQHVRGISQNSLHRDQNLKNLSSTNNQDQGRNTSTSPSTQQHTEQLGNEANLMILKLESRALELYKHLQHQQFQIEHLKSQTESLMKICDSQKAHLNSLNLEMMHQQFKQQISRLEQEKQAAVRLIQDVQADCKEIQISENRRIQDVRAENSILAQKIQQLLCKKQKLLSTLRNSKQEKQLYQQTLFIQEQRVDELRFIERKYLIAVKDLEKLKDKFDQIH